MEITLFCLISVGNHSELRVGITFYNKMLGQHVTPNGSPH
jgi:hypothetical protein